MLNVPLPVFTEGIWLEIPLLAQDVPRGFAQDEDGHYDTFLLPPNGNAAVQED